MERPTHLFFVRSLKQIALAKISIVLWNQTDLRELLAECFFTVYENDAHYGLMEFKVRRRVDYLSVPKSVREDILSLIYPIGRQLFKWITNHNAKSYVGICLPPEFCWTMYDTINEKETAKALIEDENLSIVTRYKLACTYCFEDDIHMLWSKIPAESRSFCIEDDEPLLVLWTHVIGGPVTENQLNETIRKLGYKSCSLYSFAFQYSACEQNKPAAQFFLQKLSDLERSKVIVATAEKVVATENFYCLCSMPEKKIDLLCFLISQMDFNQQISAYKLYSVKILRCFLGLPYKDICLEAMQRLWEYISEKSYLQLLEVIATEMQYKYRYYTAYFYELFPKIWHMGSPLYKKLAVNESSVLFKYLFRCSGFEHICLLFRDATVTERKSLIFSQQCYEMYEDMIKRTLWNELCFFLKQCLTNREEAKEFRRAMEDLYTSKPVFVGDVYKWKHFFWILDDFTLNKIRNTPTSTGKKTRVNSIRI